MGNVLQVEASVGSPSRRPPGARRVGAAVKYMLLVSLGFAIWFSFEDSPLKTKLHGAAITAFAFLFTLQEALFFQVRGRIGDMLKSVAVPPSELDKLLHKTLNLKDYLDRVWYFSLPLKIIALLAGLILFWGGISAIAVTLGSHSITVNTLSGVAGWVALSVGAELAMRTFAVARYVDRTLSWMEVEARQITAAQAAATAISNAAVEDWQQDGALSGYQRIPPPRKRD